MMDINSIIFYLNGYKSLRLVAAVSGGADSMALLHILLKSDVNFEVVNFEHGIRGEESCQDSEFVRQNCEKLGIKCTIVPLNVPDQRATGENLESCARRLRLAYYQQESEREPDSVFLLAHHQDDAVENLFLRLSRGSNSSGLTNLRAEKELSGVKILRPLLGVTRAEIEAYLAEQNQPYCIDSTNSDNHYQRNYLRNHLLPEWQSKFGNVSGGILSSLKALEVEAKFMEEQAESRFKEVENLTQTPLQFWQNLHQALLPRVLTAYTKQSLTSGQLTEFRRFVDHATHGAEFILGENSFKIERNQLSYDKISTPKKLDTIEWNPLQDSVFNYENAVFTAEILTSLPESLPRDFNVAYFDLDKLTLPLQIRGRQGGESYLGFDGKRHRVKQLLIDQQLSTHEREKLCLVWSGNQLIWLPTLANSATAKVTSSTKQIIKLVRIGHP